jgi:hypothetical protein
MSGLVAPGVGLGTGVLGTKIVSGTGGLAGRVADFMLPVTGIAFGLYLAVGLGLFVSGFLLRRHPGRTHA